MTDKMNALPASWENATLTELSSKPQYGFTTKASNSGTLKLIRTTDITSPSFEWANLPYCYERPDNLGKYLVRDGDILISRAGSVGVSHLVKGDGEAVFASYLIRFQPRINPEYLYWFTKSPRYWTQIADSADGITIQNVNAKKLSKLQIPVPPAHEQRRIVAKIEELFSELDDSVANLETARARLQTYRQSLLKHAFEGRLTEQWRRDHADELESADQLLERIREERETRYQQQLEDWKVEVAQWEADGKRGSKPRKPAPPKGEKPITHAESRELPGLPNGWRWTRVGELLRERPHNGRSVKDLENGFPVLRLNALRYGRVDLTLFKNGAWTEREARNYVLEYGDFLVMRGNGSKHLVGTGGLVGGVAFSVAFPDTMIRLRLEISQLVPEFFSAVWNAYVMRRQIETAARTTAGIYKINQKHIQEFLFPLPPIAEQQAISAIIESTFDGAGQMEAAIDAAVEKSEAIRQSILKRAFEGRLVSQNREDEPASDLLARIRGEEAEHVETAPGDAGMQTEADA